MRDIENVLAADYDFLGRICICCLEAFDLDRVYLHAHSIALTFLTIVPEKHCARKSIKGYSSL